MVCFRYPKCYYRSRISLVIIMKWWALRHTHTQTPPQTMMQEVSRVLSHISQQPGKLNMLRFISTVKDLCCFFPDGKGGGEWHKGIKKRGSLLLPFFWSVWLSLSITLRSSPISTSNTWVHVPTLAVICASSIRGLHVFYFFFFCSTTLSYGCAEITMRVSRGCK